MGRAITSTSTASAFAHTRVETPVAELWRRYRESGDAQARDQLVAAYTPLVNYAARRVRANLPPHVDTADLVSYGLVGLVAAIDRFRPQPKTRFDSYAMVRIRSAILDELRVLDWVPRSVRSNAREIEKATVKLQYTLRRAPTELELAEALELGIDVLRSRLVEIANSGMAALDESWNRPPSLGDRTPRLATLVDAEAVDPARVFEANELRDRIAEVIVRLPVREQLVVGLYYYENLNLREIAELVGLSKTGIAQVHSRAMQRLRSWIDEPCIDALGAD